jgi:hypothetical protein
MISSVVGSSELHNGFPDFIKARNFLTNVTNIRFKNCEFQTHDLYHISAYFIMAFRNTELVSFH